MRRKRNADDNLRRLQRASQSGDSEAIAQYWKACLRVGKMPESNAVSYGGLEAWSLFPLEYEEVNARAREYEQSLEEDSFQYLNDNIPTRVLYLPDEPDRRYAVSRKGEGNKYINSGLEAIQQLLDWYEARNNQVNPCSRRRKARNADDRLRRLERDAENDKQAALRYAEEMVRVGRWKKALSTPSINLAVSLGYSPYGQVTKDRGLLWDVFTHRDCLIASTGKLLLVARLPNETKYCIMRKAYRTEYGWMQQYLTDRLTWAMAAYDKLLWFDTKEQATEYVRYKAPQIVEMPVWHGAIDPSKTRYYVKPKKVAVSVYYET